MWTVSQAFIKIGSKYGEKKPLRRLFKGYFLAVIFYYMAKVRLYRLPLLFFLRVEVVASFLFRVLAPLWPVALCALAFVA